MNPSPRLVRWMLTVWLSVPLVVSAQERGVVVTGTVRAVDGAPIAGAVVHLEALDQTVVTDAGGRFTLSGVGPGNHSLSIVAERYGERRFRFSVSRDQRNTINVGDVEMEVSDVPVVILTGRVRDAESGEGIGDLPIRVDDRVAAVTRGDGSYRLVLSRRGTPHQLDIRRIGYERLEQEVSPQDGRGPVDLDLLLVPAPLRLEDIEVAGEEVDLATGRLNDFYRRRDMGLGTFFTRAQIRAMGATEVSDIVRRVPGAIVITEDNVNTNPESGQQPRFAAHAMTTVTFQRRGFNRDGGIRPCAPLVFINDLQVHNPDLDRISRARDLAGMEVYQSAAQVPIEYNRLGANCGVIALWTDAPGRGSGIASGFEVGAQFGTRWMGGGSVSERVGVQMLLPLVGPVELRPSFSVLVGSGPRGDAGWQAMANLAVHPIRILEPWYVGTGVVGTRTRRTFGGAVDPPESRMSHVLLAGVTIPMGPVRPFFEIQVFDGWQRQREWHSSLGLTVRTHRPPPPPYTLVDER